MEHAGFIAVDQTAIGLTILGCGSLCWLPWYSPPGCQAKLGCPLFSLSIPCIHPPPVNLVAKIRRQSHCLVTTMEVVGFTAAAISIAKATKTLARFTHELWRAAKGEGRMEVEIKKMNGLLQSSLMAVKAALESLRKHCPDDANSSVIRHLAAKDFPADLARHADDIRADIRSLRQKITNVWSEVPTDFGRRWVASYRWNKMKPEVEALLCPLESFKTTLTLTINIVVLETRVQDLVEGRTAVLEWEM